MSNDPFPSVAGIKGAVKASARRGSSTTTFHVSERRYPVNMRRPVGSSGPFKEQHELPTYLADFAHFTQRYFLLPLRQSLSLAGVLATRSLERGLRGWRDI